MKNWKLSYKVMFFNCAIIIAIGILCAIVYGSDNFGLVFGVVCLIGGLLDLLLGLIIYLASAKEIGKGFLNSGGILLLLSGISCGTGLSHLDMK